MKKKKWSRKVSISIFGKNVRTSLIIIIYIFYIISHVSFSILIFHIYGVLGFWGLLLLFIYFLINPFLIIFSVVFVISFHYFSPLFFFSFSLFLPSSFFSIIIISIILHKKERDVSDTVAFAFLSSFLFLFTTIVSWLISFPFFTPS